MNLNSLGCKVGLCSWFECVKCRVSLYTSLCTVSFLWYWTLLCPSFRTTHDLSSDNYDCLKIIVVNACNFFQNKSLEKSNILANYNTLKPRVLDLILITYIIDVPLFCSLQYFMPFLWESKILGKDNSINNLTSINPKTYIFFHGIEDQKIRKLVIPGLISQEF